MAKPVEMPRMGYDMTEGKIQRWIKHEGDSVSRGDVLAEIETDKVSIEIEAFQSGVLRKIVRQEGEVAQVGEIIAVIGEANEEIDLGTLGAADGGGTAATTAPPTPDQPGGPTATVGAQTGAPDDNQPAPGQGEGGEAEPDTSSRAASGQPAATQATNRRAPEGPLTLVPREGGIERRTGPSQDRLKASPIARRLAEEHGVALGEVSGTGPSGRIVKDDIENYLRQAPQAVPVADRQPAAEQVAPQPVAAAPGAEEVPLTRMRQTIARVTAQSKQQAPHFYLTVEVNMDAALALRAQLNQSLEGDEIKLSVNDFIVKASAKALVKHRFMNASFAGDKIIIHPTVDIGIAVSLEQGLISPIIRNADVKALSVISRETRDLAARARAGTIRPDEFSGGTFTISNLGMFDIDEFGAIIVQPQAGILAVGAAKKQAIVNDAGKIVAASIMKLTLSADHRVTDGAQAAVFLNEIRRQLETPMLLVV